MDVTCQKYGDPATRRTVAYPDDDPGIAVADTFYLTHWPEWEGAVTLVEVLDGPPDSLGVWHVEDLGRIWAKRAAFARRARPDELAAIDSGDAVRATTALAATNKDRGHTALIRGGALFLESLFAPHRMARAMHAWGDALGRKTKTSPCIRCIRCKGNGFDKGPNDRVPDECPRCHGCGREPGTPGTARCTTCQRVYEVGDDCGTETCR